MSWRRRLAAPLAGAALASLWPLPAAACRCAPPGLHAAYDRADLVAFAEVVARTARGSDWTLALKPIGEPYKGRFDARGEFITAASSAGCGIAAGVGGRLLVFGERDSAHPARWQLHSCNGSREFGTDGPAADFADVPARHVLAQLQARHAATLLQQVARAAPGDDNPRSTRLVGLWRADGNAGRVLRLQPGIEAPILAELPGVMPLVTREIAYEEPAAVVYARQPGWLRVRLKPASRPGGSNGFGWLAEPQAGSGDAGPRAAASGFTPYAELLPGRLTYLTAHWLRLLWPEPGAGLPLSLRPAGAGATGLPPRQEWPAVVHESRKVGHLLWLRVDLLDRSPCEEATPRLVGSGWTPAYGTTGEPAAWFYSRGC